VAYNITHNITPTTVKKSIDQVMAQTSVLDIKGYDPDSPFAVNEIVTRAAEPEAEYNTIPQLEKLITRTKKEMEKAARDLDFMEAARLRDEMFILQKKLEEMKK
ncbi:MAG: UvrB/UvrC motif-containing protein, partial [Chitinophagaceae bacterium]